MAKTPAHDVAVIGGGPAGLTAALYTTRLGHDTALVNEVGGRSMLVENVHNLAGVSEDVSGYDLFECARAQLDEYGAAYYRDHASEIRAAGDRERRFRVRGDDTDLLADRLVLATGFHDLPPRVPELLNYSGRGLHYCIHCDGYLLTDESVYVLGHGDDAAEIAMILLNFTDDVDLLLDGEDPEWSEARARQVRAHPIAVRERAVAGAYSDDSKGGNWLGGLEFEDGTERDYAGGFAVYGLEYNNELARQLGCELTDDGAVAVDESGRTSVDGVYAVGDLTPGHDQTPIVMGEGAAAGIALHRDHRTFPMSIDEIEADGPPSESDAPSMPEKLRERARTVRHATSHAGMRPSDRADGDD